MLQIETIAIVGTGRDAVRTALLCSLAGLHVRLFGEGPEPLDAAFQELRRDVEEALSAGLIGREERQRVLDGILFTPDLDEAAVGADLAFAAEAVDGGERERALLTRLASSCRATALLALRGDPTPLASAVPQPGRVVGLALEETGTLFPRVTLRAGPATTEHARMRGEELAARIDRAAGAHR